MRYGVNLDKGRQARLARRRGAYRKGVRLGLIAGFGSLLIATQLVSGCLLRERVRRMERTLAGPASAGPVAPADETLDRLDALLASRRERTPWYPKLAALSDTIPDEMFLTDVIGLSTEAGRSRKRLEVTGHITGEDPRLAPALDMVGALKTDPRITGDLPYVDITTARGTMLLTVQIICAERPGEAER